MPQRAEDLFVKDASTLFCIVQLADQAPLNYIDKSSIRQAFETRLELLEATPLQQIRVPRTAFSGPNENEELKWSKQFTDSSLITANSQHEITIILDKRNVEANRMDVFMPQIKTPCFVSCQTVLRSPDCASNWQCKE